MRHFEIAEHAIEGCLRPLDGCARFAVCCTQYTYTYIHTYSAYFYDVTFIHMWGTYNIIQQKKKKTHYLHLSSAICVYVLECTPTFSYTLVCMSAILQ